MLEDAHRGQLGAISTWGFHDGFWFMINGPDGQCSICSTAGAVNIFAERVCEGMRVVGIYIKTLSSVGVSARSSMCACGSERGRLGKR